MFGESKKRKKSKRNKARERQEQQRRLMIILEARKIHEKNRKKLAETTSSQGYTKVNTLEQDNLGYAVAAGVTKAIVMSGNMLDKLKARRKSLSKSRSSHMARLKKARKKFQARSRT